jgi:hypothetical protein
MDLGAETAFAGLGVGGLKFVGQPQFADTRRDLFREIARSSAVVRADRSISAAQARRRPRGPEIGRCTVAGLLDKRDSRRGDLPCSRPAVRRRAGWERQRCLADPRNHRVPLAIRDKVDKRGTPGSRPTTGCRRTIARKLVSGRRRAAPGYHHRIRRACPCRSRNRRPRTSRFAGARGDDDVSTKKSWPDTMTESRARGTQMKVATKKSDVHPPKERLHFGVPGETLLRRDVHSTGATSRSRRDMEVHTARTLLGSVGATRFGHELDRIRHHVNAPREKVYRALIDANAIAK